MIINYDHLASCYAWVGENSIHLLTCYSIFSKFKSQGKSGKNILRFLYQPWCYVVNSIDHFLPIAVKIKLAVLKWKGFILFFMIR